MEIDFFSFKKAPNDLREKWANVIKDVINEGRFIGGRYVEKFENDWRDFTKSSHAIGVSNGMDGLILGLRSLNIGQGKIVAVPAHTFIATWNAIIAVGATPLGIDVDEEGLIDLNQLSDVASKIDAVIPVHMHGSTVDMKALNAICTDAKSRAPIAIMEDASQAHGAVCPDGSPMGMYSDVVVYSLYPTKNLGALGDAGIITTNTSELSQKIRSLRNYGSEENNKYNHKEVGFNNRLDPLQASVLSVNLNFLEEWNMTRRKLSSVYIEKLGSEIPILQITKNDSVRHHLCILVNDRDILKQFLLSQGIKTEIHYPNCAGMEAMSFLKSDGTFPKSEVISKSTISLPLSPWHSEEEINYVASQVLYWYTQ